MTNLAKVTDLTKFRRTLGFDRKTQRNGYNESGEFDENDEFGESHRFDEISPEVEISGNEPKRRVQQKWRI